jgi:hypothetical protein
MKSEADAATQGEGVTLARGAVILETEPTRAVKSFLLLLAAIFFNRESVLDRRVVGAVEFRNPSISNRRDPLRARDA